jgi:beta-N-acetylhexosaminidase
VIRNRYLRYGGTCVAMVLFNFVSMEAQEPALTSESPERSRATDRILRQLTLEQKIGQMLQIRFYGDYGASDDPEYVRLREDLHKYHIGSVVLGMHVNRSGFDRVSALDAARTIDRLQRDSEIPLLVAADIERGLASRMKDVPSFPWPMALGAIDDARYVQRFAAITATEARAIGIQWALAPVADVNSNSANPVINDRSFGEDPEKVSALVEAYINGARANGLLVTAKHFPGHGDSSIDSHRGVPSIDGDLAHLRKYELPPFQRAIEAGVDSVMLAHARVPALDPDPKKIATISTKIVTGTLKNEMGFKGVVITDALEMKGITSLYDPLLGSPTALAAVDAVKAGCDVIMIPTDLDGAFRALLEAVRKGEISESRVDDSVRKILEMKAAAGLDKTRFVDLSLVATLTDRPEDAAFAQRIADDSITLVRNDSNLLPFTKLNPADDQRSAEFSDLISPEKIVVIILGEFLETAFGQNFEREFRQRSPNAAIFHFDGRFSGPMIPQLLKAAADANKIVLATYVVHQSAKQTVVNGQNSVYFGLQGLSGRLFQEIIAKYAQKTAVISLGSPYLIESYAQIRTYICTYAMASTSEVSAVKALFGEVQNHATVPVTLPGVAPRGFSLAWPQKLATTLP